VASRFSLDRSEGLF